MQSEDVNTVITSDTSVDSTPKKKVIIAIPGDSFSSKFLLSWTNTIISLFTSPKYDIAIAPGTGSFVQYVRMQTLGLDIGRGIDQKPFNGDDFDIWLTIDSDIIFTPDQIFELLEATDKHPVVSGLYRMADLQHFAAVQNWDQNYFAKHKVFEYLTQEKVDQWKSETGLKYMPVNYTGLGFFACRKEVLYKMQYPYFDGDLKECISDTGVVMRDVSSEDVCFCHNITKAGYEIVVNVDIRVGHLKPLVI